MAHTGISQKHEKSGSKDAEGSLGRLLLASVGRFFAYFISLFTFAWLFLEFVAGYIFGKKPLAGAGVMGVLVVVLGCAFLALFVAFGQLLVQLRVVYAGRESVPPQDQPTDKQLADTLFEELDAAYQDEDWEQVLKIGSVLSRPLWITGKYRLRVRLGKLVEAAAAYGNHPRAQAAALIDDLGWTSFVLGQEREARNHIRHGIRIAEEHNLHYLAYKGYRHLSGIALENGDLVEADAHCEKAEQCASQIEQESLRNEALAGTYVNQALLDIRRRNWEDGLRRIEAAQALYREIGDREREVKLYHYKGDILLGMGRLIAAKDVYREGLSASKRESRKDGILRNSLGIAKVALEEGDVNEARHAYREAADVAKALGLDSEAAEIEGKLARL